MLFSDLNAVSNMISTETLKCAGLELNLLNYLKGIFFFLMVVN